MKRSEMVLNIASELVNDLTNFMPFDKAQCMAEIILTRIQKDGMIPPMSKETETHHGGYVRLWTMKWEPEVEEDEIALKNYRDRYGEE